MDVSSWENHLEMGDFGFPFTRHGFLRNSACLKVGSRAKGTQVQGSDGDLKIMGPSPVTREHKQSLGNALRDLFGEVVETPDIHKAEERVRIIFAHPK
jgi:hypothetical protein